MAPTLLERQLLRTRNGLALPRRAAAHPAGRADAARPRVARETARLWRYRCDARSGAGAAADRPQPGQQELHPRPAAREQHGRLPRRRGVRRVPARLGARPARRTPRTRSRPTSTATCPARSRRGRRHRRRRASTCRATASAACSAPCWSPAIPSCRSATSSRSPRRCDFARRIGLCAACSLASGSIARRRPRRGRQRARRGRATRASGRSSRPTGSCTTPRSGRSSGTTSWLEGFLAMTRWAARPGAVPRRCRPPDRRPAASAGTRCWPATVPLGGGPCG